MTTLSRFLCAALTMAALAGCSTPDPVTTKTASGFSLASGSTYDIAPLKRRDGKQVRPEIARAVEETVESVLGERGLRRVTDNSSDLTVVAQGGIQPRSLPRYSRYTARTGVPVVQGYSFDIDEENDATIAIALVERRTGTQKWWASLSKGRVPSKPSPQQVSQAVREILAHLPGP